LIRRECADRLAPSTRAEPTPTGWSLSGTKTTVPAGPLATVILVSASTPDGPALFAVTPGDPGVQISRQRMVDHDDAGWLELTEVQLAADRQVGTVGAVGTPHLPAEAADGPVAWVALRGTVALCAHQLGVLERALELTAEYAATRTQFDRPIGSFQAVTQRLADAYIQVQALRLTLWKAAWMLAIGSGEAQSGEGQSSEGQSSETEPSETGTPAPLDTEFEVTTEAIASAVATAKFWAAEAGHHVAHTCVHVHGGAGIDVEHPLHRYFLAAKRAEFELGGATAQLLTLGALLAQSPS
jgi:alkylation response protein AidB-like acyl-CoA dehydrogenase